MGTFALKDVFPIENGDLLACYVNFTKGQYFDHKKEYNPRKLTCPLKRYHFILKRLVFQPHPSNIFQRSLLVFVGVSPAPTKKKLHNRIFKGKGSDSIPLIFPNVWLRFPNLPNNGILRIHHLPSPSNLTQSLRQVCWSHKRLTHTLATWEGSKTPGVSTTALKDLCWWVLYINIIHIQLVVEPTHLKNMLVQLDYFLKQG